MMIEFAGSHTNAPKPQISRIGPLWLCKSKNPSSPHDFAALGATPFDSWKGWWFCVPKYRYS